MRNKNKKIKSVFAQLSLKHQPNNKKKKKKMSTPLTRDDLSEHDKNVLDSIFNPFQIGGSDNLLNFDELLPEEVQGKF